MTIGWGFGVGKSVVRFRRRDRLLRRSSHLGPESAAHSHVHYVIARGGLSPDHDRFIACKPGFFLPVRVLSALFPRLLLAALLKLFRQGKLQLTGSLASLNDVNVFLRYLQPLHESGWVVYAKPPFGGPHQVPEYLGRYTHRVAISNQRLGSLENGQVTFRWKDYRHEQRQRTMTLSVDEFIRRFLIHSLPASFQRIRSGGFLANRHRKAKLTLLRQLLHKPVSELLPLPQQCAELLALLTGQSKDQCPNCLIGRMRCVELLSPLRRASAAEGAGMDSS